jgi:hypothetical protein
LVNLAEDWEVLEGYAGDKQGARATFLHVFKCDSEKILRTKSYLVEEEWNSKSYEDY